MAGLLLAPLSNTIFLEDPRDHRESEMKVYIYGLYSTFSGDKEAPAIRYVGKTINPEKRFLQHLNDLSDCYKARWIRKEQALGNEIKLTILETLEDYASVNWPEQERYWMEICAGNRITNSKIGGGAVEPFLTNAALTLPHI